MMKEKAMQLIGKVKLGAKRNAPELLLGGALITGTATVVLTGRASFRQSYDDIEFDTREDAEEVLDRMDELIEQYGIVTVGDLFDLAGVTGNGYTDQNYGWTSVASATIERDRHGGYFIKMTRPSPIR